MQDQELERYSRHILLSQLDYDGQQTLLNSRVMVIGVGGLGSAAAQYLAGSGIGHLTLVDDDVVDVSNLHRQVVHTETTVGMNKALSAKRQLTQLNSSIEIKTLTTKLNEAELLTHLASVDLVLDCTDNSASRMLHNRVCVETKTPLVSAAAIRMEGQLMVVDANQQDCPCYQCVYPDLSDQQDTCSQSGILGPVVGIMGVMQALEGIKLLTSLGASSCGKLISFDALDLSMRSFTVHKNPKCSVCALK